MSRRATLYVKVYKAADGWRWRLRSANGRIVADSGEAYSDKSGATRAARRLAGALILVEIA